jgi:mono/diheme cytochrome c family protein
MRRHDATLIGVFALVWLILTAVNATAENPGGNAEARKIKNPVAASAASIKAGEATYKKYCAFCHNTDATGEGPLAPKNSHPPSLVDDKWDHGSTDGEIFATIQSGAGPTSVMKGFKGKMPDQDLWNVINYLRSLGPKKTS